MGKNVSMTEGKWRALVAEFPWLPSHVEKRPWSLNVLRADIDFCSKAPETITVGASSVSRTDQKERYLLLDKQGDLLAEVGDRFREEILPPKKQSWWLWRSPLRTFQRRLLTVEETIEDLADLAESVFYILQLSWGEYGTASAGFPVVTIHRGSKGQSIKETLKANLEMMQAELRKELERD